jgi:hypothetical protein
MRTSLDHTKEAALQAALTGVQAVVPPDGVAPSRTAVEPVLAGSRARRKPVAMMDPDRAKLQIAAVVGAVFGILTGYVVGQDSLARSSVPGRSTVIGHLGNATYGRQGPGIVVARSRSPGS